MKRKPRTISKADDNLCRLALHYAICERDGFADSYRGVDPKHRAPGRAAARLAERFRKILARRYGQRTIEDKLKNDTTMKRVNILDVIVSGNRKFQGKLK